MSERASNGLTIEPDVRSQKSESVTDLLKSWSSGDDVAGQQVLESLYVDLHHRAERCLRRERAGHTLQPTALVNEAYLRLERQRGVAWSNRSHFLAIAAKTMRRVLLDHARKVASLRRGGVLVSIPLDEAPDIHDGKAVELEKLDEALKTLETMDRLKAAVVELRFFGGLSIAETAEALDCSPASVVRHWRVARAWLYRELGGMDDADGIVATG